MRRFLLAAALASGLSAGLARAQPAAAPATAAAHAKRVPIIVDAKSFDPGRLLPPPPPEGSDAQKAELEALHRIQATRTPERYARAKQDGEHEDASIFSAAIGPAFDLNALPATRRALETVVNDQSVLAKIAKSYFKRPRPYVVDPTLEGCERSAAGKPPTSYPSGHATLDYSLAYVLKALLPQKADAIGARAGDYAYSRLVCVVHYPSDVDAGRTLGTWIGKTMLDSPSFQPQLEAARAELKAAGLR